MTTKVAISLPAETFRRLEVARKKGGITRSAAVQRAIEVWLASADRERRAREYIEGYRRCPEEAMPTAWTRLQAWGPPPGEER